MPSFACDTSISLVAVASVVLNQHPIEKLPLNCKDELFPQSIKSSEPSNEVEPSDGNFSVSDFLELKSRYSLRFYIIKVKRDAPPFARLAANPSILAYVCYD